MIWRGIELKCSKENISGSFSAGTRCHDHDNQAMVEGISRLMLHQVSHPNYDDNSYNEKNLHRISGGAKLGFLLMQFKYHKRGVKILAQDTSEKVLHTTKKILLYSSEK